MHIASHLAAAGILLDLGLFHFFISTSLKLIAIRVQDMLSSSPLKKCSGAPQVIAPLDGLVCHSRAMRNVCFRSKAVSNKSRLFWLRQ